MQIIGGKFRGCKITAPKGSLTRPTSSRLRETLFNIVQSYIEDAAFLDLYAGSGAMGFEALSRGAANVTFVDQSIDAMNNISANAKQLKVESLIKMIRGDVFRALEMLANKAPFDIIYADAPYAEQNAPSAKILQFIDSSFLLKDRGMLFIEDVLPSHNTLTINSLQLISTRKSGPAYLHQYQRIHQTAE